MDVIIVYLKKDVLNAIILSTFMKISVSAVVLKDIIQIK